MIIEYSDKRTTKLNIETTSELCLKIPENG